MTKDYTEFSPTAKAETRSVYMLAFVYHKAFITFSCSLYQLIISGWHFISFENMMAALDLLCQWLTKNAQLETKHKEAVKAALSTSSILADGFLLHPI